MGRVRGDGTTTRQMQNAPIGAVYIWVRRDTAYPKRVAEKIGRTDLKIVWPNWLTDSQWQGNWFGGIILDHAAAERLTDNQWQCYVDAKSRIK